MNDDIEDQDGEPTSTAPDGGRPQSQSTASAEGEPKTNVEAGTASDGGPETQPEARAAQREPIAGSHLDAGDREDVELGN